MTEGPLPVQLCLKGNVWGCPWMASLLHGWRSDLSTLERKLGKNCFLQQADLVAPMHDDAGSTMLLKLRGVAGA